MKRISQTMAPPGSDICSLPARYAGAKSCYKPNHGSVQIWWNKKMGENHLRDDKSREGIATKMVGKTLEKPNVLHLIVFRIIKYF